MFNRQLTAISGGQIIAIYMAFNGDKMRLHRGRNLCLITWQLHI